MQQLIDVIITAIATDASTEQKAAGVQACRTISTALDTEPGKPLMLPGSATAQPTARLSIDQLLDLAIARLNVVATDRERAHEVAEPMATAPVVTHSAPRGLQIPLAPTNAFDLAPRLARGRPVPQRGAPRSAGAPRSQPRRRP